MVRPLNRRYTWISRVLCFMLICLKLLLIDSVTATGAGETPETLWGEGKPDPKDVLEQNGFQMRKVALTAAANPGRRGRGPRNRKKGGKGEGGDSNGGVPAAAS